MSQESDFALLDAGSLERGRFRYFPVAPGRLEFAVEVRRLILKEKPQVVAVELPTTVQAAFLDALKRLPQLTVLLYTDEKEEDRAIYIVVEPADPFTEAVRTALETGAHVVFVDPDLGERPHLPDNYPDPYSIPHVSLEKYIEAYRLYPQPRSEAIATHAAGIAWKLQGTDPEASTLVVLSLNLLDPVLDAMEIPQSQPRSRVKRREVDLLNPHPDCLPEICAEYPYLQERYERYRTAMVEPHLIDRRRAQFALLRDSEKSYEKNTGERLAHWHRKLLARFGRNLALSSGELAPGIFDIVVAARSIVDDNYAWDVWAAAGRYPAQMDSSDLPTVNLSGDEIWLDTKKLRLRRRLPRARQRVRPANLRERKKEKSPGEWARQLNGNAICSYPPEDLVVEDFGRFLKKKAKSIISEERSRTEPFTTSILDGIDLRETVRNWHEKKIYVQQFHKLEGEVGSLIVAFDEDRDERYSYLTTWLGENQNESDMAFYSTDPFEHIVGPGIGRAEYGGFLMSLPPRRMYDVWGDPDYDLAETKPERLLMAGLDYSIHRYVVYVAPRPPRSIFRSVADRFNRSIIYIPIGQLSSTKLKKVRVVHVLDSYDRRQKAREYIW